MEKILKQSFIYKILAFLKSYFTKLIDKSILVQAFLTDKFKRENIESSTIVKVLDWLLKWLRIIARKLKFDKIFENSIFAKPLIWATITIALAPVIPTMMVLVLAIASMLSLLLMASIDEDFKFKRYRINSWVFAFAIVIAISSLISISMAESIKIAMLMIAFVMFYFVVINVITTRKQIKTILYVMLVIGTFTAIYGIYQYAFGDVYSQAWLDSDMFEDIKMRVYSTLENPNVYGEYLLLIIPFTVSLFWTEKGWKKKLFLLVTLGIMGLALILTFSRGCWLGIIFSIAILALIIDKRFIFLGILLLLLSPFILPDTIISRFTSIGNMEDTSTSYRVYIWMGTLSMLKDYWISGVGMGITSFNTIYPLYSYNNIKAPHSHNLYLQLIVEFGIVGFAVMIGVMYNYFKMAIISMKAKKDIILGGLMTGMMGFLLQSMTDHTWYNYRVVLIFWVIVGLTVTASKINLKEKENDQNC
ncbi:MAG: O-antigen ligase family protein [Clostridia bacterium]|nr:O-antigen ligase family protein [Clostridia bacterium]